MASLQTELIDLQENVALREVDRDTVSFWTKMVTAENFPSLQKVAVCVHTMFGSTYRCESAFSAMNVVVVLRSTIFDVQFIVIAYYNTCNVILHH